MDVRRIQLFGGRTATLLDNNLVRCVIEDQGGMGVELSAINLSGGRENSAYLSSFRSCGCSEGETEESSYWKDTPIWKHLAGSTFVFPNYGPACVVEDEPLPRGGVTAVQDWMVQRYGTDAKSGGVWMLSSMRNRMGGYLIRKIDLLLPGQNVHYTATSVTNQRERPIKGNAVWTNHVGAPFLETGCVVNACAKTWMTQPDWRENLGNHGFDNGVQFDDLSHIPTQGGKTLDYTVVPPPNGFTDLITGRVPRDLYVGWSSVINPRQQMLYFTFFPGPMALEEGDMPVNFNNFLFNYGGMDETPFVMYDKGSSQSFSLDCGSGTGMLSLGLEESLKKETLMGVDTNVTIPPGETRTMYYASAFLPFENPRIGLNFFTAEESEGGMVVKRTKSWAFIASDTRFSAIRRLRKELIGEKSGSGI
ncbi:MAG: hypothetical protein LKK04_07955 [Sphaerochaeta sp.]|jgi:hypothetical protein|nr:hypothetical protein [Sphaerochaeta sp.]